MRITSVSSVISPKKQSIANDRSIITHAVIELANDVTPRVTHVLSYTVLKGLIWNAALCFSCCISEPVEAELEITGPRLLIEQSGDD